MNTARDSEKTTATTDPAAIETFQSRPEKGSDVTESKGHTKTKSNGELEHDHEKVTTGKQITDCDLSVATNEQGVESGDDDGDDDESTSIAEPEEADPFRVSIKDFAYHVSDPRHFGIYDDIEYVEGEFDDDMEEDEVDEEEYSNYEGYNSVTSSTKHDGIFTQKSSDNLDPGRQEDAHSTLYHTDSNVVSDDTYYGNEDGNNEILHAVALYPFVPENSNELSLVPDQILIINYECGDGWLVAHDPETGETGLVPSEYIRMLEVAPTDDDYDAAEFNEFAEDAKDAHRFMPEILDDDDFTRAENDDGTQVEQLPVKELDELHI